MGPVPAVVPHWLLPYESLNSEYSCACALACKLLLILDCSWAMAEAAAAAETFAEEDTTVVRPPLPMGLAELGTVTESNREDGEQDEGT